MFELREQIFVGDTKDGGLSSWLESTCSSSRPEQSKKAPSTSAFMMKDVAIDKSNSRNILDCYCHCRGVQFYITRPDESSSDVSAPASDLLVPFHSQSPEKVSKTAWWLRANGTKYFAGTCACNSCRLASGYDIQAWAFVPKTNIKQMDGKELDYTMGTLKRYSHTNGVYREFCGVCGATVFWHYDERPGVVDVSVGLLDAEEGARAEKWLEWATERVSFEEHAQNRSLISSLSKGLKRWGSLPR
ncbi:MAG: hypothetical protein Q9219_005703 [cf. Caloplaca sp. 3 TL-2023]